jgi:hypothetical protein
MKMYGIFDGTKFINRVFQYEKDEGDMYLKFLREIKGLKKPQLIEITEYKYQLLTLAKN